MIKNLFQASELAGALATVAEYQADNPEMRLQMVTHIEGDKFAVTFVDMGELTVITGKRQELHSMLLYALKTIIAGQPDESEDEMPPGF